MPLNVRGAVPLALVTALVLAFSVAAYDDPAGDGPLFRSDDPIWLDGDKAFDAGGARPQELGQIYDFLENTFASVADRRNIPAVNVNTLDEVPDSSWFTNRLGRQMMSDAEVVRGPDRVDRLEIDEWTIVAGKSGGLQPGFQVVRTGDPSKQRYQIEFDPPDNPEIATGAEIIGTAIYHALGYNVVDVYLTELDVAKLRIAPTATIRDRAGRRRPFNRHDLDDVLRRAARLPSGRYRAIVSRFADGEPMGNFRYYGTRPDDPNDIYPHEHRRELRASRVFAAWLNHDDSRANNTLDMMEGEPGQQFIRHYMFDFGSILGSATVGPNAPRSGHEYLYEPDVSRKTLLTFGLWAPAWARRSVPSTPAAVGRFTADGFEPRSWRPEYPNAAFDNMRPDDAFWGARRVAGFSDEMLRQIVEKAEYSDPRATDYLVETIKERRDRIARVWLTGVTPIIAPRLSAEGWLSFENAAVEAGAAAPPARYTVSWSRFDNLRRRHEEVGGQVELETRRTRAPAAVLDSQYVCATLHAAHPDYPQWMAPVRVYFRRDGDDWTTVGFFREDPGAEHGAFGERALP
ncbi:MAG: hypothetical protein GEV06_21930 [Luteitalea sp.]|nr:hypothetical protein [Luteitalea sp.]